MHYTVESSTATYASVFNTLWAQVEALRTTDTFGLMHSTLAIYTSGNGIWTFYRLLGLIANNYIEYAKAEMGAGDGYMYAETVLFRSQNRSGIWNGHVHSDGTKAIMATGNRSSTAIGAGSIIYIIC